MSRLRALSFAVAAAVAVAGIAAASAAAEGSVHWQGSDPESGSQVLAYSWGLSSPSSGPRGAGKPKLTDFTFTRAIDSASPRYHYDAARGKTLPAVQFSFPLTAPKGSGTSPEVNYCMSKIQITGVHDSLTTGEDLPTESVDLSYQDISVEYSASILNIFTLTDDPQHGLRITFGHTHTTCPQ